MTALQSIGLFWIVPGMIATLIMLVKLRRDDAKMNRRKGSRFPAKFFRDRGMM